MSFSRYFVQLLLVPATALAITSEEASLIAWKAYGKLIQQYITANAPITQGTDFIYVVPPTSQFIRGGTPCPESVTNFELYNFVDPLQSTENPLLGTDGPSYCQSLETYLRSVAILDKELTDEQKAKVGRLNQTLTEAIDNFRRKKRESFNAWRIDEVAQYFNQSFQSWVADNDPQYANYEAAQINADATYNNYLLSIYGSKYELLQQQRTNINNKAQQELGPFPGYNMPVYPSSPNYAVSIKPFVKNEINDFVAYRPAYTLGGYENTCDAYFQGTAGITTLQWSLKNVDGHDWSSLGYTKRVTKYGGGFWSILGASKTGTSEVTEFNSWSGDWQQDVKITFSMKGAPTLVPINAGFWDVGAVRKTYPNLRVGEKDDLAGKVRLTHALVAYQIGLTIEFTNLETWKNVSQFIETGKKSTGGGLRIFGFSFGGSRGGSYSYKMDDLKTKSTTSGGVITIPQTPEGSIFLLGARGKAL